MFRFESSSPFSSVSSSFPHSLALSVEGFGAAPWRVSQPSSLMNTRDGIVIGDTFNFGGRNRISVGRKIRCPFKWSSGEYVCPSLTYLFCAMSSSFTRFFSDSSECSALCHQQGTPEDRVTKVAMASHPESSVCQFTCLTLSPHVNKLKA